MKAADVGDEKRLDNLLSCHMHKFAGRSCSNYDSADLALHRTIATLPSVAVASNSVTVYISLE